MGLVLLDGGRCNDMMVCECVVSGFILAHLFTEEPTPIILKDLLPQ
jgi:hypothetical protein